MLLHLHQYLGFDPSLFRLQHVQVHLVTVEIGVVGWADAQVETEGLPGMTRTVWAIMLMRCNDGCRLKGTMSPSIRCRSIMKPTSTVSATVSAFLSVTLDHSSIGPDDVVDAWQMVLAWGFTPRLTMSFSIDRLALVANTGTVSSLAASTGPDLVDREQWVWGMSVRGGEVDTLTGQVGTEPPPPCPSASAPASSMDARCDASPAECPMSGCRNRW